MTGPARRDDPLPAGYGELLEQVKTEVRTARLRAARAANTELVALYWRVGRLILDRQAAAGWGTRVIERLAADLRAEFPQMRGLSRRNLFYMRSLAAAYGEPIVQQPVAQLPWGHVTVLLDKLDGRTERDWYAAAAAQHGWSRDVLAHQITRRLQQRTGAAPSNVDQRLPAEDSDLARQLLRDPYVFDFLDHTERTGERELETALRTDCKPSCSSSAMASSSSPGSTTSRSTATTSTSTCCSSTGSRPGS